MRKLVVAAALAVLSMPSILAAQTPPKPAPGAAPAAPAEPPAQVEKIKVGAYIQSISKFDIPLGTYNVDLTLEFTAPEGMTLGPPTFDVLNGDIEKDNGKPKITEMPGGTANHKKYRVQAIVNLDIDFRRYPFDEQDLSILIYDPDKSTKELVFEPDADVVDRDHKVKIPGFTLSEPEKGAASEESLDDANVKYSVYTIPLTISRPTLSAFNKTYTPLLVMVLISMCALVMGPGAAPARMTTVTGTLLGAVMFHLSTTSSLPPIGYVTLTDKVFIATYLSFLINIGFSVVMIRKNDLKQEAATKNLYSLARIVVPAATLLFYLVAIVI